MRKAVSYLILLSALFSCADGIGVQETGGRISVELMADVPVKSPTVLTPEEASMYRISVLDASGNPAVHESPQEKKGQQIPTVYYKDFETVTVLLDQQYQVTAESCTVEESEQGYGCARYLGNSGLFTLNASNIYQEARITCYQTNALVTVVFDPSVSGRFTDLKVTLTSGGRTLEITESAQETKAYFTPDPLTYTVSGIYAETSYEVNIPSASPVTLDSKDNVRIIVKLDLTHGQVQMPALSVIEEYAHDEEEDCVIDPYM